MMKKYLILLMVLSTCSSFLAISNAQENPEEQSYFYSVNISGKQAGYHKYTIAKEMSLFNVSSETFVKVKVMGEEQELTFREQTQLNEKYVPISYNLEIETSQGPQNLTVDFKKGVATELIESGGETLQKVFTAEDQMYLLDNNLIDHYNFLLQPLDFTSKAAREFEILVPQVTQVFKFTMQVVGEEEYNGKPVYKVDGNLLGIEINLLVDKELKIVDKISIPSQNYEGIRESEEITEQAKEEIESQEVMEPMVEKLFIASNVDMGDYKELEMLEANIQVAVAVLEGGEYYLNNENQKFEGKIEDNWITGTVEIKPITYRPRQEIRYPLYDEFEVDKKYLQPEPGIQSDDPELIEKAGKIIANANTVWGAIRRINLWVTRQIEYKITGGTAKDCYASREGDCGPQASLTIAFLRAAGIPARMVGGLQYAEGKFGQHNWVEVWVGEDPGWVPIDPTMDEHEKINAGHITLWIGMGTVSPSGDKMKVEVIDFD